MNVKFVTDKPVLLLNNEIIVIGDLHLGIEYELYRSGFSLPSLVEKLEKRIERVINETGGKVLILLGDVKHNIPQISYQEEKEIPRFLKNISKLVEVHVVPGNHDGKITDLSPKNVQVHSTKGFKLGEFYFNHGHSWPGKGFAKSKILVMAHSHPAVEFVDSLGYRYVEPCWIRCKLNRKKLEEKYKTRIQVKKAIIIPAFNPLISGMPINRSIDESFIGPLMRSNVIDLKSSEVYLLDGTYLGKVKNLE